MKNKLLIALFLTVCCLPAFAQRGISLDGEWTLDYWQQGRIPARGPEDMSAILPATIKATVPGNVELDLLRAGLIEEPMMDSNVYRLEKWEGYQWRYSRMFTSPEFSENDRVFLRFEGIDCFADIWLNGQRAGESSNMLIAHSFEVSSLLAPPGEPNTLEVYIRSSVIEGRGQITPTLSRTDPSPEGIYVRRAPHTYGWDIMPRLVSAGLWRSVYLDVLPSAHIRDTYWYVESLRSGGDARLYLDYTLSLPEDFISGSLKAEYSVSLRGKAVAGAGFIPDAHAGRIKITIPDAELWWPRGYGDSPLYDVQLRLSDHEGNVLDTDSKRIGIRTVQLDRTDVNTPDNPGRFCFIVNGEKIFIKGSNWTPLDALHSRDTEHLDDAFRMALELNCNMLRCWGGNVYEDHPFYDLCDRNGILVWQDFSMGCAQYPQDYAFQEKIGEEVRSIVCKLRNHPSIALWSGNNENDASIRWGLAPFGIDPNRDIVSRQTIPGALFECDPTRPYLPSSPYYSPGVVALGFKESALPEDHLWGPRGYYKAPYYSESACLFASEIGYHGMPCRESLEQMFSAENVYPWSDAGTRTWKDAWLTKSVRESPAYGYTPKRNNLMLNQVKLVFGEVPEDLDRFIEASQSVQAEALKYFIELFRSAKFAPRTGILWWNIRDGWPIISDAVVDWYNRPKKAYEYIKRSQTDVCVMIADAVKGKAHPIVAVNDTRKEVSGSVEVTDAGSGRRVCSAKFSIPANGRTEIARIKEPAGQGIWIIRYTLQDGTEYTNHYLYGSIPFNLDKYLEQMKQVR